MNAEALREFVSGTFGYEPNDLFLYERALTHSSTGKDSYERLEFLGDRVLGLVIARWLFERFPDEPEGKLSRRFNALVSRETCAEVGRRIGLPGLIRLGRQAREDGASQSDNVLGDVVESLIGAVLLDAGLDIAENFIRQNWTTFVEGQRRAPKHPKSALQELAAARGLAPPLYELVGRTGAHHSPRFTVRVTIGKEAEASAEGSTKQEAETAAAASLLDRLE